MNGVMYPRSAAAVRWIARITSVLAVGFVVVMAADYVLVPGQEPATTVEFIGLLFFPIGVCCGLVMGWWREATGGTVAVGSLFAFYLTMALGGHDFPTSPYFALITSPGVLFLLAWLLAGGKTPGKARGFSAGSEKPATP